MNELSIKFDLPIEIIERCIHYASRICNISQTQTINLLLEYIKNESLKIIAETTNEFMVGGDVFPNDIHAFKQFGGYKVDIKNASGYAFPKSSRDAVELYLLTGKIYPKYYKADIIKLSKQCDIKLEKMFKEKFNNEDVYTTKDVDLLIDTIKFPPVCHNLTERIKNLYTPSKKYYGVEILSIFYDTFEPKDGEYTVEETIKKLGMHKRDFLLSNGVYITVIQGRYPYIYDRAEILYDKDPLHTEIIPIDNNKLLLKDTKGYHV